MEAKEERDIIEAEKEMEEEEKEENDSSEEDTEDDNGFQKKRRMKINTSRQKWSVQEMNEIRMYFSEHLNSKTTPRSQEIEKAKAKSKVNGGLIHLRANHLIIKKISYLNHK